MTYNFDPDKWYDNEKFMIDARFRQGDLTKADYDRAVDALDQKLEEMWQRLDNTYQVNDTGRQGT